MSERRQVHRREPVIVELDSGEVFTFHPLTWLKRNDLGDEILQQAVKRTNEYVKLYVDPDTNMPQLEAQLHEKLVDPLLILALGLDLKEPDPTWGEKLRENEVFEMLRVILEVNGLERLSALIDPNFQPPMTLGGNSTLESESGDGEKTTSLLNSSLQDSQEGISSP